MTGHDRDTLINNMPNTLGVRATPVWANSHHETINASALPSIPDEITGVYRFYGRSWQMECVHGSGVPKMSRMSDTNRMFGIKADFH